MAAREPPQAPPPEKTVWQRLPFPFGAQPWWIDGTAHVPYKWERNPAVWRKQVIDEFEHHGFDVQVFLVAASGFLTDSYALFATNVILPSLAYLYWPHPRGRTPGLDINLATLVGSAVGQLLFGWLADKLGRRKLYGLELVLVIFGTLGMAQASTGMHKNMDILSWFIFYRFLIGVGIGAEYPLSAVITAEFSSTDARARMMAAVFLMQPLGQILAAAVGWGVLAGLTQGTDIEAVRQKQEIDRVWRWVIGVGAIPAIVAILWRFSIPESPRYTMDVNHDPWQARTDTWRQYRNSSETLQEHSVEDQVPAQLNSEGSGNETATVDVLRQNARHSLGSSQVTETGPEADENSTTIRGYLIDEGNWRYLFATAFGWFLLDFAFYGLGINNPGLLDAIWAPSFPNSTTTTAAPKATTAITIPVTGTATYGTNAYTITQNLTIEMPTPATAITNTQVATAPTVPFVMDIWEPTKPMYKVLVNNARYYIFTISVSSLTGSILLIWLINYVPRKMWLVWTFVALAVLFIVTGSLVAVVEFHPDHWAIVVFYALCQFFFNLGPNTLIFMIPAEIFPTKFRATCHGFSAACGKVGAIAVLLITEYSNISTNHHHLGFVLGIFAIPMALGALFSWVWIPELQTDPDPTSEQRVMRPPRLPNKSLERLAKGRAYAIGADTSVDPETGWPRGENQKLGFLEVVPGLWSWIVHRGRKKKKLGASYGGPNESFPMEPQDASLPPMAQQSPRQDSDQVGESV